MSSIIGAQLDAAFYEPLARRFCGCRIDAHVIFRGRRFTRETHHQPVSRRNPASRAERVAVEPGEAGIGRLWHGRLCYFSRSYQ